MQFRTIMSLLLGLQAAATVNAVAVLWANGMEPTPEQHAAAVARAEARAAQPALAPDAGNVTTLAAAGCVQAHCGWTGPASLALNDVWEIGIFHNGEFIFDLLAGRVGASDNTYVEWWGPWDKDGAQWGFRTYGMCGAIGYWYVNSDWNTLDGAGREQTTDDGWCGQDKCLKQTLVESVYTEWAKCGSRGPPRTCDFAGRCESLQGYTKVVQATRVD